ncbi:MAG: hypothetical protein HFH87_15510 [Lachnospiraceae bacterium]|nr:hypothetical protein [Lachnospiraceae bacterium]
MKIQRLLVAASAAMFLLSNGPAVRAEDTLSGDSETPDNVPAQEISSVEALEPDETVPDEAPMFSAWIELSPQGYTTVGTIMESLPDTCLVQPLYSLDGESWQTCKMTWNDLWGTGLSEDFEISQTNTCLYSFDEPLASYLAGKLDRFYLKLQITLESGITYETQSAVIDRGVPQPLPEEFSPVADFIPAMRVRQWRPFVSYGQYQLTVSANMTPEDIAALLPDMLPVEIQIYQGIQPVTDATVNCPVTWKPLALSQLVSGESVVIEDAAEEIIVPAGTLLSTPNGIYQLKDSLGMDHDEIRLVLNVVAENAEPIGVLSGYFKGLEISFGLKPTGATAIRVYTLSEGKSSWTEVPDALLPAVVNAPSSTADSLFTFVLSEEQEPYRSYLAAENAGDEAVPFLVGLKIEGGVYDGRQLILAWPDTYKIPLQPPTISGLGGNEGNAGSDNKSDSTLEGQRPDLPQNQEDGSDAQAPVTSPEPDDRQNAQAPAASPEPDGGQDAQTPAASLESDDRQDAQAPAVSPESDDGQNAQAPAAFPESDDGQNAQGPETSSESDDRQDAQGPETSPKPDDGQDAQAPAASSEPDVGQNAQEPETMQNPADRTDTRGTNPAQSLEGRTDTQKTDPPQSQEERDSQPKQLGTLKDKSDRHTARKTDSPSQSSMDESIPILMAGTGSQIAVPVVNAQSRSLPGEVNAPETEGSLPGLLLSGAAILALGAGILLVAGKVSAADQIRADNRSGKVSVKIIRRLCRLLSLK